MHETEAHLLAGGVDSGEEETEDSIMSPISVGPLSPHLNNHHLHPHHHHSHHHHHEIPFPPKEGSPYEVPVYIPDDIPVPSDLELRESSVPGAGLGIWAKTRIGMGEHFGPHSALQSATVKDSSFGWEVGHCSVGIL
uniref:Si:ch211-263k4.2 n=1 Tax=Hucho hucho TaxID=62062 RepID=A0A4W5JYF1_9TELE